MSASASRSIDALTAGLLAAGLCVAIPGHARAADADSAAVDSVRDGTPVSAVEVVVHDVFDPLPPGPLGPVYRTANALHLVSHPTAVRPHLLFAPGEPWSERRAHEQMRLLRDLDFVDPLGVTARRAGDSAIVTVETRDTWTTQPEFNLERGGNRVFGTFGVAERNLFGLGKSVGVAYSEDPTGTAWRVAYGDPAVLGSHVRFVYNASNGTSGANDYFHLWRPFYAEDTPWGFGVSWDRTGSVAHLFEYGSEVAFFARDVDDRVLWGGLGRRNDNGTVSRVELSLDALDRVFGPSTLQPGAPPEFAGGEERLKLNRVALEGRLWKPDFIERSGIERFNRVEDFDVGPSMRLMAGYAPRAWGSTANEGYLAAHLDLGADTRFGFGTLRSMMSTRLRRGPLEFVRQAEVHWVKQQTSDLALVLGGFGAAGTDPARDFQQVLGGLNGLRAYPVQALAGYEAVRLNAEQRWIMARDVGHLLSLGSAVFYDLGHTWGPGAQGTSWFNDAGFGIRIAPPTAMIGPGFRVDVAWPIEPPRNGKHQPAFSFGSTQAF